MMTDAEIETKEFQLPDLPYSTDALEPHIDQATMEIHHRKHHGGYVRKLNQALQDASEKGAPAELVKLPLLKLLSKECNVVPAEFRTAIRNNGGGHANHSLFWQLMSPQAKDLPEGPLAKAIDREFGDLGAFKRDFEEAAMSRFGSGWAWLVRNSEGGLEITSTPNQDSPLMYGQEPILGLDVWEHAYYLKYQNRRKDYVRSWWLVLDWKRVAERFQVLQERNLHPEKVLV